MDRPGPSWRLISPALLIHRHYQSLPEQAQTMHNSRQFCLRNFRLPLPSRCASLLLSPLPSHRVCPSPPPPPPSRLSQYFCLANPLSRPGPVYRPSFSTALGPIPPELGNLWALTELTLGNNRLTGPDENSCRVYNLTGCSCSFQACSA